MRHMRLLCWGFGVIVLAALGCHSQPNLKPPDEPEVLCTLKPDDKRNSEAFCLPSYVLSDGDAGKLAGGISQASAKSRPTGAVPGGMGMGGMSSGGMGGGGGP
jgi:hypothetical protein